MRESEDGRAGQRRYQRGSGDAIGRGMTVAAAVAVAPVAVVDVVIDGGLRQIHGTR